MTGATVDGRNEVFTTGKEVLANENAGKGRGNTYTSDDALLLAKAHIEKSMD